MRIGAFTPFSTIDYPGYLSAVVFAQGCNLRCAYCHNKSLVEPALFELTVSVDDVLAQLRERVGLLDGVVITGGEPLLQLGLRAFIDEIRALGFRVKLDTNGSFPQRLSKVIDRVDYCAIDVKACPDSYQEITGRDVSPDRVASSLQIVRDSGTEYEVRLTLDSRHQDRPVQQFVNDFGAFLHPTDRVFLQPIVAKSTLANVAQIDENYVAELRDALKVVVGDCSIRAA